MCITPSPDTLPRKDAGFTLPATPRPVTCVYVGGNKLVPIYAMCTGSVHCGSPNAAQHIFSY